MHQIEFENELDNSKFNRHATAQKPNVVSSLSLLEEQSETETMPKKNFRRQAVRVYVRSKKVAIRSAVVEIYASSITGPMRLPTRFVDYEDRLDDTQKSMVEYATDLAMSADLPIKIVDVAKLNVWKRLGRALSGTRDTPAIVLPEALFLHLRKTEQPPKIWEGIGVIPR
jgi:hypothetical protein